MSGFRPHRALVTETVTPTAAIAAQHFVTHGGAPATTGDKILGSARTDGTVGVPLAVDALGLIPVIAGAAVNPGDDITTDAQGRAIPVPGTGAHDRFGTARNAVTAAGGVVMVLTR